MWWGEHIYHIYHIYIWGNKNYVETWAHISASLPRTRADIRGGSCPTPNSLAALHLLSTFLTISEHLSRNILTSLKISAHLCSSLNTSEHLSHLQYFCRELNITAYQFPWLTVSFGHSLLIHTMSNYQPTVAESSQEHSSLDNTAQLVWHHMLEFMFDCDCEACETLGEVVRLNAVNDSVQSQSQSQSQRG